MVLFHFLRYLKGVLMLLVYSQRRLSYASVTISKAVQRAALFITCRTPSVAIGSGCAPRGLSARIPEEEAAPKWGTLLPWQREKRWQTRLGSGGSCSEVTLGTYFPRSLLVMGQEE